MATEGETAERVLDAAFERVLLESARDDAPVEGARQAAWARFAATAGAAAVGAGVGLEASAFLRAVRRAGARWFAIGAVSGSLLTAGWMAASTWPVAGIAGPRRLEIAEVARDTKPVPSAPAPARTAPVNAYRAGEAVRESSKPRSEKSWHSAVPRTRPSEARASGSASTLAREIEALDAVQTALTRRDFDRALELAERYPREFPSGQLGAEAAALGIEALAGQGNRVEAKRRAEIFLDRYPKDPHRARVAAIAER
jgi:hypothetical protein